MKTLILSVFFLGLYTAVHAQLYPGPGSNEDLWQTEDQFNSQDEFFFDRDESDFRDFFNTESNDVYINEYEIKLIQDRERKKIEAQKKKEADYQKEVDRREERKNQFESFVYEEYLFQNILYGVATGGVIGLVFSKAFATNIRQRLQYLGTGVILGAIVGISVGSKEIYFYDIPPDVAIRDTHQNIQWDDMKKAAKNRLVQPSPVIGFRYHF